MRSLGCRVASVCRQRREPSLHKFQVFLFLRVVYVSASKLLGTRNRLRGYQVMVGITMHTRDSSRVSLPLTCRALVVALRGVCVCRRRRREPSLDKFQACDVLWARIAGRQHCWAHEIGCEDLKLWSESAHTCTSYSEGIRSS